MRTPRARACSSSSSTSTPAPSPSTNPSRPESNGRDACVGSSLRVDNARIAAKPATPMGAIAASLPPANMTSASPRRMIAMALPMASEPAAQAVHVALSGPLAPSNSETWAAPMLGIIMGIRSGLTRSGPFSISRRTSSSNVARPPTPLPMTAPIRSASGAISSAASSRAMLAAATAYWANRSRRRMTRRSMKPSGSKPATSPAMCTVWLEWSKRVISATPDRPASRLPQTSSTSQPSGVTHPSPVTTTRFGSSIVCSTLSRQCPPARCPARRRPAA